MEYQSVQFVILPDGSYAVLQAAPQQSWSDVIGFGIGVILTAVILGLAASIIRDSLRPAGETNRLLADTRKRPFVRIGERVRYIPATGKYRMDSWPQGAWMEKGVEGTVSEYHPESPAVRVSGQYFEGIPAWAVVGWDNGGSTAIEAGDEGVRWERVRAERLPRTIDNTGHRELFDKLEAMTPEQRQAWAIRNGWGSTADSAYRSLFSSSLRNPLRKGETWRSRARAYIDKYYPDTIVVYPPSQPAGASQASSGSWGDILNSGAEVAVPAALTWLLADNRLVTGMDLLPATEESKAKVEAILQKLKSGVESIQQSDQFRLFLSTMGKFHDYSIGNMILIMLQKPSATHVAGFNTWKELGRWVKAGEKGIAILAPVMPPRPVCEQCGAKIPRNARYCGKCGAELEPGEETAAAPKFFRLVHVFDLSQTEGRELPEFEVPSLSGAVNEELFKQAVNFASGQGLTVSFESKPEQDEEIKGYLSGKLIWVRPEESRAQQLKTLLHETAHYFTEGLHTIPRRDAETIAESAAFAVGAHFGFDSGTRSFPYVALWAEDKKVLDQNLAAIRQVVSQMIDGLEATA